MQKGEYTLRAAGDETNFILEINDTILNEPFVEATQQLNNLVDKFKSNFGGRDPRRRLWQASKSSVASFTQIEEPTEAKMVWATILDPSGERHCCAVAFKISNRVVYQDDVMREMNSALSRLKTAVESLDRALSRFTVRRATDESSRLQERQVFQMTHMLGFVKGLMEESRRKRAELQNIQRKYPENPITRVMYPSFTQRTGEKPEWQSYQTQLAQNRDKLFGKSKKLKVDTIAPGKGHGINLTLVGSSLVSLWIL